jgi:hypothetical protein
MTGNDIVLHDPQAEARPDPDWVEVEKHEAELQQATLTLEQLREQLDTAGQRREQAECRVREGNRKSAAWRWLQGKCLDKVRGQVGGRYHRTLKQWGIDRSWAQRSVSLSQRYTLAQIRELEGTSLAELLDYSQARPDNDDTSPHLRAMPRKGRGRGKRTKDKGRWVSLLHHQAAGLGGEIRLALSHTGGRAFRLALSPEHSRSVRASLVAAEKEAGATGEAVEEPAPDAAENQEETDGQPEADGQEVTRYKLDRTANGVTLTFFGRGRKPVRDPVPLSPDVFV